ncbi:UNKNOWN [Stylonychia lemnae]|uniref:Transmembrane protein n=1 Tax=Stylonychia lemnae TaxID=5949 RepID=A0A078A3I5_STYLE|nr:UNKNOWN [Stylonychia lemnae]|eukprot:CDW76083.1 UNKNOWN [Stylonychia lemnae]
MSRQVNRNRARNPLSAAELAKVFQPKPKIVTFFDIFTFGVIAAAIFFNSLTARSIIFNVSISAALLLKVFIGVYFYKRNNARSLRLYFMFRFLYNVLVIYPLIAVLKFFTGVYVMNNFIAGGILALFELIITGIYMKYLFLKTPIENIEDIPGYIIKSKQEDLTVLNIKSNRAADYLSKSYGKKSILNIIKKKQIQNEKQKLMKNSSGKPMGTFELLQRRQEDQHRRRVGFNLIRPEDEIEAEIQFEIVQVNKKANSSKYMSFELIHSRDVVNDVKIMDQKEKQKIQYIEDAREDIEREKEKFRRAMEKMKGKSSGDDQAQVKKNQDDLKEEEDQNGPIVYTDQVKLNKKDEDNVLLTNEEDVEQQSDRAEMNRSNINDTAAKSTNEKATPVSKITESKQQTTTLKQPEVKSQNLPAPQQLPLQNYQSNRSTIQTKVQEEVPQRQARSQQRQSQKQKFKSYEEKFEIQRLQIQKQQQKGPQQPQQRQANSNGRNQQNQSNKRKYQDDDYDSEDGSDSYDSEDSERRRRRKKIQQINNQQKKIHGVNDGDSSSSLSEDDQKKKSNRNQKANTNNNSRKNQSAKGGNQKQVRFDENKNTIKNASELNRGLNQNKGKQDDSYDTEGDSY